MQYINIKKYIYKTMLHVLKFLRLNFRFENIVYMYKNKIRI